MRTIAALFLVLTAGCAGIAKPPPEASAAAAGPAKAPEEATPAPQAPAVAAPATPASAGPATPGPAAPATDAATAPAPTRPTAPAPTVDTAPTRPTAPAAAVAAAPARPTAPAAAVAAVPARPTAPAAAVAAAPPLDLQGLEKRLKATKAIGVFTKLALKNQVDDLLDKFRAYHRGRQPPTLTELRPNYELLIMKVQSLIQEDDPALASDVAQSREAIWGVLADKSKFALI